MRVRQMSMKHKQLLFLTVCLTALAGCHTTHPVQGSPPPIAEDTGLQGTVVGDERTAMEAAVPAGSRNMSTEAPPAGGVVLAPNAPDSYVVKKGDTLWGIAGTFLRDPWYWPEIWHVNPQIANPHWIYPGDTLRLVYVQGQPQVVLQRGDEALVVPRVRSEPWTGAVTAIPYEFVAAFMSKPTVLAKEQIDHAAYLLASLDDHETISAGDTVYARGFNEAAQIGSRYTIVHIGEALRDPDDRAILGYNGVFAGAARVTRGGDPVTLVMTESARESIPGDKVLPGNVDVALDFVPNTPKTKVTGTIIHVTDGVAIIGQYEVVTINRGTRDGLSPGNVLAVYHTGDVIPDNVKHGFLIGQTRVLTDKVKLPDERTGTFMVFKTFDRLSYGLIMEAKNLIKVGDRVENP